ncbi:hypothetical protein QR98_0076250 [Sarcoptes scabiei]|uniref:Uncharacterized protein n=1 Tax=Sarcoptes scabiei TaxID=52283 RepID=A0A132ADN5_SARSC|nr:hypothetical protein QR98_0076250 [Sarcoptes scabiei]
MIGNRDFDDVNKSREKLMAIKIEIKRFLWPFVILNQIYLRIEVHKTIRRSSSLSSLHLRLGYSNHKTVGDLHLGYH